MATSGLTNLYHRRLVADSAAKPCWICYKPSSTVLITPDSSDYFYLCAGHLSDSKFAIAKDAEDLAEKKRQEQLEREIESVKKEYQDRLAKKAAKKAAKDSKDEKKSASDKEADEAEKEKDEKVKELEAKKSGSAEGGKKAVVEGPRVFELQKQFFQMRLQRKRDAERARQQRERMRQPGLFPSVPSGEVGGGASAG